MLTIVALKLNSTFVSIIHDLFGTELAMTI
jgi:hypothetical protein